MLVDSIFKPSPLYTLAVEWRRKVDYVKATTGLPEEEAVEHVNAMEALKR